LAISETSRHSLTSRSASHRSFVLQCTSL
jgi:hypothetical protein